MVEMANRYPKTMALAFPALPELNQAMKCQIILFHKFLFSLESPLQGLRAHTFPMSSPIASSCSSLTPLLHPQSLVHCTSLWYETLWWFE